MVSHRAGVAVWPDVRDNRRCDVVQAATVYIYVAYTVAANARDFMWGTCLSGPCSIVMH